MIGRRLPDTAMDELPDGIKPGDFWKLLNLEGEPWISDEPGNLTHTSWMICAPNGCIGTLRKHTVREHEDGMITVAPDDGSTNSIAISGTPYGPGAQGVVGEWHGYVDHGRWYPV